MKSSSLLTLPLIIYLLVSCGKTVTVEPVVDNSILKNECQVETSEVAYKDQDAVATDGFVRVEKYYTSDGKYKETKAYCYISAGVIAKGLVLKNVFFNNEAIGIVANDLYQITTTKENAAANWRFTLPDGKEIELCTNQFPKAILLDKVPKPVQGKSWDFSLDISNSKADYLVFSNFLFSSDRISIASQSSDKLPVSFDKYALDEAQKSALFFKYKELTLTAKSGKSFIKTVKGKKINIIVESITEAGFPLF
jgi:hypothetical protein